YPALKDRRVGWRKPVFLKMLGEDLCFFRGKSGRVVAFDDACPHRGAMLSHGKCAFRGHIACFYHGFVFDERGECVAALGEGPRSPMPGKIRARVYPTETRKGIVFVWMGKGAPVPLEESIPEDFFEDHKQVLGWHTVWPANWRPCFENSFDSHVRYLHRSSAMLLMKPMFPPPYPPSRPQRIGPHRLAPSGYNHYAADDVDQEYFPGLDAKWPRQSWRWLWVWLFARLNRLFDKFPAYTGSADWGMGQHLPCMVRIDYRTYMWTRWAVPIDANTTRMFYFHAAVRPTVPGRAYEFLAYHLFHHWVMDRNFSAQDAPAAVRAYYDRPEYLAPTDAQLVGWRRFLLTARGTKAEE
ncbi:MAG: Rieske 2Fe-2S domain-containing protein, partial [Stellaceae bacterium]